MYYWGHTAGSRTVDAAATLQTCTFRLLSISLTFVHAVILLAGGFTESSFVRAYFKEQIGRYAACVVEVPSPG